MRIATAGKILFQVNTILADILYMLSNTFPNKFDKGIHLFKRVRLLKIEAF